MAYIHTLDSGCRVLLIMNPASGMLQSKANVMYRIITELSEERCLPMTLLTEKKGDATAFVERYAGQNDIVVCCGGDGTLNETITGMMHCARKIPIGFIPCGTTNDTAKTMKLPTGNVKKAVRTILTADNIHQDVGDFCGTQYFTYVASFGAFTKVSYATPRWKKHLFGHMAYIMDGILAVGDIRPWQMKIECDQYTGEGEYAFGSVTNATSIAGLLKLDDERVSLNDGKFEVMLIRHPKTPADMQQIIAGLAALAIQNDKKNRYKHLSDAIAKDNPMLSFFHTDAIRITPREKMPWTIDGEYGGTPDIVNIRNLHGAVELLRKP